jgi:hypothetical protein
MRVLVPALLSLAALGYASSAHALDYEVGVRPGVGGAGTKSPSRYDGGPISAGQTVPSDQIFSGGAAPYGAGFVGALNVGVRFASIFTVGLAADVRFLESTSPDGVSNLSRNMWTFGPYGRVYFPLGLTKLEPWVGVGFAYLRDTQNFTVTRGTTGTEKITTEAVTLPLSIGALYPVLNRHLSVGPSFTYAPVFPSGGCVDGQGFEYCHSDPPQSNIVMVKEFGLWTLGLDIQATFP